jgi:hypothetical protein
MRSKAPVVLFTTLFALASGSALALGDRAKEKKAASDTPSSQSAQNPSGSGAPNTTSGMQSTPNNTTAGATTSSSAAPMSSTSNKSQVGQNDARCDESKYTSKSAMPKECFDKAGTGASASGSIQGQSGGANGSGASAASSGAGSSSSGSTK